MNNALLGLAGLLIAVLAALFAVPYFIDWNGYRSAFEDEASRVLGRDVRVGGKVDVRLLPVPYVSFAKVRVADTANDTGDPFFRADSFTMWLSVSPLLRGHVEARQIELLRPVLRLVVDPQGSGNWSQFSAHAGSLPFGLGSVALQAVGIRDGAVSIVRGQGGTNAGSLAELAGIDGELEAETLEGPFRFKGQALWQEGAREIRLATSKLDPDGGLKLKASVRVPATGNTYALDGRLSDIRQRPRLDGEITARIALEAGDGAARKGKASDLPALDAKGRLEADGTGLRLREIAGTLENVGQPQLVSGEAQMAWVGKPAMEARFASRLLDLDRIAGVQAATSAVDVTRGLLTALGDLLPAEAEAVVGLDVDQATLGGDSVSALSVAMQRSGGQVELKHLRAGVPGGGRIEMGGRITTGRAGKTEPGDKAGAEPRALGFDGTIVARGTSLARFLAWGAPRLAAASTRPDSAFLISGRLLASDAAIELADATAEIGSMPLSGSVRLGMGERRAVAVRLDGRQINLGQLWPEAFATGVDTATLDAVLPGLAARLGLPPPAARPPTTEPGPKQPAGGALLDLAASDFAVQLTTGELVVGADVLTDVDADVAIERGKLVIKEFKATTAEKLGLEVGGQLADAGANTRGLLRWTAEAPTPAAAGALLRLAGVAGDAETQKARLAALAPLRLAGTLALSQRAERATDLTVDGNVSGGRIVARVKSDGDRASWRTAPLDATVRLDGADALGLLRAVLPGAIAPPERGETARAGQLFLKVQGVPDTGLATLAALDGEGLDLSFDGRWLVAADGQHALDGAWKAASGDARSLFALAGLTWGGAMSSVAVDGGGTLALRGGEATLTSPRLALGGSIVSGRAVVKRAADKPTRFDADIAADTATLAGMLAAVSAPAAPQAGAPAAGSPASVWPQEAIDTRALDALSGRIVARIGRLTVEPGMTLAAVTLDAAFAPGRIDIVRLDGGALGGRLASKGALEKAPLGVKLVGGLTLDGVGLEALATAGATDAASGPARLSFEVTGQGSSAAAVVAALSGRGEAVVGPAEIAGFAPAALVPLAEAAIAGKGEREGEGLLKAVREAVAQGRFKIAQTKIPIEIADGTLRAKPLVVESEGGRSSLLVAAELTRLRLDAEWQIEARLPKPAEGKPEKGPLPPVSVVYVGRMKDWGNIEPRIDVTALGRELEVRKMERDVEELERLRKLDEERVRAEQERQRALEAEREAERQRAAEAAAAAEKARAEQAAAAAAAAAAARPPQPADGMQGAGAAPQPAAASESAAGDTTATKDAVAKPVADKTVDAKPAEAKPVGAKSVPEPKSGDWKAAVEKPAPSGETAVVKPPPAPKPVARPRPPQLTPESIFKQF